MKKQINIIKVKHNKSLIILDLNAGQLICQKDAGSKPDFYKLSEEDCRGFLFLFETDKETFLNSLKEDLADLGIITNINDLKIVTAKHLDNFYYLKVAKKEQKNNVITTGLIDNYIKERAI